MASEDRRSRTRKPEFLSARVSCSGSWRPTLSRDRLAPFGRGEGQRSMSNAGKGGRNSTTDERPRLHSEADPRMAMPHAAWPDERRILPPQLGGWFLPPELPHGHW